MSNSHLFVSEILTLWILKSNEYYSTTRCLFMYFHLLFMPNIIVKFSHFCIRAPYPVNAKVELTLFFNARYIYILLSPTNVKFDTIVKTSPFCIRVSYSVNAKALYSTWEIFIYPYRLLILNIIQLSNSHLFGELLTLWVLKSNEHYPTT